MSLDFQRLEQVLAEAAARADPAERAAYLDGACGGDRELRAEVERLLAASQQAGDFLECGVRSAECDLGMQKAEGRRQTADTDLVEKVGTVIGRYKLLEEIGEGGFGVVYMAEQTEPVQRKVALKVVKAGMDTREVVARFEAERQALALMDHPNIARVFDGGVTQAGRPYFVMELVRGIPITEFCDQRKLSTPQRLRLFIQVCHAVQHAHHKGIIHRDLKPSNILVTLVDGEAVPKVIDFGVAKALGQRLTEKTLFTGFLKMVGTPAYMSPEQADLSGVDIDTRADIYALGVLLYELLTGETPFDSATLRNAALDEIRRMIQEAEPPKPSTRLRAMGQRLTQVAEHRQSEPAALSRLVRGDLDWIVMKCLEKERARRYATANNLAADIERHLEHEPVTACPPSAGYRLRKFACRNKGTLALVGTFALALLIGAVIATGQAIRATRAERLSKRQEQVAVQQQQLAQEAAEREKKLRISAEEQRQRADSNRQRAEANLRLALDALDGVYLRVAQRLERGGARPEKEDEGVLHSTLDFYERFALTNRAAKRTQGLIEDVYARLVTIRRDLVERFPQVVGYRRLLSTALVGSAGFLENSGRSNEARAAYEQAIRLQEQLVESFPAIGEYRTEAAVSHERLAGLLESIGRSNEAGEHHRKAQQSRASAERALEQNTPASIKFDAFAAGAGLDLLGDARVMGNRLRLTPAQKDQRGACWVSEKKLVAFGFETVFDFQLSGGADGFAFVIQNHGPAVNRHIGYDIPNSIAIEFDTALNVDHQDPPRDHLSVQAGGKEGNGRLHWYHHHAYSLGTVIPAFELKDGKVHNARFRYVPGELAIFLDHSAEPALTIPVELASIVEFEGGKAWVGFTAGTGGGFQTHDILKWEFRPLVDEQAADAFLKTCPSKPTGKPDIPSPAKREAAPSNGPESDSGNVPFLQSAQAFYRTLAEQNYGALTSQGEMANAFVQLAQIEATLGETQGAEPYYRRAMPALDQAIALYGRLAAENPGNLEYARELAGAHLARARLRRAMPSHEVLDRFDSGWVLGGTNWQRVSDVRAAPAGTRLVRVRLLTKRHGNVNDGHFDDLVLRDQAGRNLLRNPGNEEPYTLGSIPGWIGDGSWQQGLRDPPPHGGTAYFLPDVLPFSELRQDIDLSSRAASVQAGQEQFTFEGYIRSRGETSARIVLEYRCSAGTSTEDLIRQDYLRAVELQQETGCPEYLSWLRLDGDVRKSYRNVIAAMEKMAVNFPGAAGWHSKLARAHTEFGDLLQRSGDPAAAIDQQRLLAIEACSKGIAGDTKNPQLFAERAQLYVAIGDLFNGSADFSTAAKLDLGNPYARYYAALGLLRCKDREGYHQICADMCESFGRTSNAQTANWVAWTCALAPEAVTNYTAPMGAAELAAGLDYTAFPCTLGAILYRAGRLREAIECLTKAARLIEIPESQLRSSPAYIYYFLAMAHCRMGDRAEARLWLEKATGCGDKELNEHKQPNKAVPWNRRATLHLLGAEAEALIQQSIGQGNKAAAAQGKMIRQTHAEAVALYERLAAEFSGKTEYRKGLAAAYRQFIALVANGSRSDVQDCSRALALADKAIELTGQNNEQAAEKAALWHEKGKLLEQAGDREKALDAFAQAIELGSANTNLGGATLKRARLRRSDLLRRINRLDEAAADRCKALDILPRDPRAPVRLLDLSVFYNAGLKENAHGDVRENNLAALPVGIQTLAGTPFDIRGLIQVSRSLPKCPTSVTNIPVGQVCQRLQFLHAAFNAGDVPDGRKIGRYSVRYANGQQAEIPMVVGQDVADWWELAQEDRKPQTVAWTGTNGKSQTMNRRIRLFKTTWNNPDPDLPVATIDFQALDKQAGPFVVAITAE